MLATRLPMIGAAAFAVLAQTTEKPGDPPPTPGTVSVVAPDDSVESRVFADAVERALPDAGFVVLPPPSKSRYIATFAVSRHAQGIAAADGREPPSTLGQTGNWGARLRTTLPSNKTALHGLVVTQLEVRILLREPSVRCGAAARPPCRSRAPMATPPQRSPKSSPAR